MAAHRPGLAEAFSALGFPAYRQFAISLLLTSLGAQLLQVAIFWQVYELTGSALLLGLTGLARALPHMVLSLVGGVVADRWDRVRLIQIGQVGNGLLVFGLAAVTVTGSVEVWHLYAITVLNSALTAVTQPARTAIIPRLVPGANLVNAIALNATIQQVSQIVGPALGGVAIGALDLGPTYAINGAIYVVAMLAILGIRVPRSVAAVEEGPWQSFLEGMRFVRARPAIISLLALDVGATLLGSYRALLPLFSEALGVGPTGYGVLSAAPGVGSLVGAAWIMSRGDMRYKGLYTVAGVLGYSVSLVLLAVSPSFWLAAVASALLGATNSIQMIPRNSAILGISPDALRGRVEAFRSMLAGGAPPLGYTLSGAVAAAIGAPLAVFWGGVACALFTVGVAMTRRELRDPDLGVPIEVPATRRGAPSASRTARTR
ncbi:MAG: MFS transporter [Dehalococcoidia bacterium]|nr:MFS transporter [Dehalococcoidia bacterium]